MIEMWEVEEKIKDALIWIIPLLFIFIVVFSLTFFGLILVSNGLEVNCNLMAKNGYETHLETYWFFFKDCYISTETGAVPYDRFMLVEVKE